jgi:hypothetical protein
VTATAKRARSSGERERRLRAFVIRTLADADAAGFTLAEVIQALKAQQEEA